MESIETIRVFLGWCTAINMGMLLLATVIMATGIKTITGWNASMFDMEADDVKNEYFRYLATYKALVLVFNLVPYVALRIMA